MIGAAVDDEPGRGRDAALHRAVGRLRRVVGPGDVVHLDVEALVEPGETQVLRLHQLEVRRDAVEDEEGAVLLVELAHLGHRRPDHRHFAQPADALRAPALAPDQRQLVEDTTPRRGSGDTAGPCLPRRTGKRQQAGIASSRVSAPCFAILPARRLSATGRSGCKPCSTRAALSRSTSASSSPIPAARRTCS